MDVWRTYVTRPVSVAPLVTYRVIFGAMMFVSTVRFLSKGWVEQFYLEPDFFFTYYGFGWVAPLGPAGMYAVFALLLVSTLAIMVGWHYRWAVLVFFLAFNYTELIDKSTYLNHYYFISIIAFLMLFLPADRAVSLDVRRRPDRYRARVPAWTVNVLRFQIGLVYFYAGVAKLNYPWLAEAMPLSIWLPARADWPIIGPLFAQTWTAYAFSWAGALYDLTIPFLLAFAPTRWLGFGLVVAFHVLTRMLFPIGMFPFIMIGGAFIFFSGKQHERAWQWIAGAFGKSPHTGGSHAVWQLPLSWRRVVPALLAVHLFLQVVLPWRYLLYPGQLFWTEQGYRFSWRVMLMEKAGHAMFYVTDPATGNTAEVRAADYLRPHQEKMMATQPDMILQFAHYLDARFREKGIADPEVRVQSRVTLNGAPGRPMIDPGRDLSAEAYDLRHRDWIFPQNAAQ